MSDYSEKLKDPRWQKKRLSIFKRDKWTCQLCGDKNNTLVVHHKDYLPDVEPWDYPDDYLTTYCEPCHNKEAERQNIESELINSLRLPFTGLDVDIMANGFRQLNTLKDKESFKLAWLMYWVCNSPKFRGKLYRRLPKIHTWQQTLNNCLRIYNT